MTERTRALLAAQRELGQSEWWSPGRLRAHQARLLDALTAHAARHVPFYEERQGDTITRQDIQEHGDRLTAQELPPGHGKVSVATTGGSSGVPVQVKKTELAELFGNALHVREEVWHRTDPRGTMVRLRRVPEGLTAEEAARVRSPAGLVAKDYGPPTSLLWPTGKVGIMDDRQSLEHQAAFMERMQPMYLFTFPSNLRLLCDYLRGMKRIAPVKSVWTMSEAVDPGLREQCREVFGCKIVHNYSAAEAGYLALQCPEHEVFHVQAEAVAFEVLRDDGRPAEEGEVGRAIITPLYNYAMPLIRYELGDRVRVGGHCPCGRGLPVLSEIVGRDYDYLLSADGSRRPVDQGYYKLGAISAIREFQIAQVTRKHIEARLVLRRPLEKAERAAVRALLREEFGEGFGVAIVEKQGIERTAAGKLRAFVSELRD